MKNLKKLGISSLFAILLLVFGVIDVNAATVMPTVDNNKITLTEDVILENAFKVETGSKLTIDLNGFDIVNKENTKFDTIYVEKGAELIIEGTGTISNVSHSYAPLLNNGKTTINGGTLSRDMKKGVNSYYVILNHGTMVINENVIVKATGDGSSSLVANGYSNYTKTNEREGYVEGVNEEKPNLTINGGTFDGGMNTIKNDDNGVLTINDGTFKNTNQVPLMNWNEATINGGTFETPAGADKTSIFLGSYGPDSVDKGILVINGGTFNAEYIFETYAEGSNGAQLTTPVKITDGTFNYTKGFFNTDPQHISTGLTEDAKPVVTGGIFATNEIMPSVNDDLEIVEENGKYVVQYKDADYSEVDKLLQKVNALDRKKYTKKSLENLDKAVNEVVRDKNINEQAEVDAMAEKISIALNALQEAVKNPETFDNIKTYMILIIVSLVGFVGVGNVIYNKKRFN